jgi:hypothetical protein
MDSTTSKAETVWLDQGGPVDLEPGTPVEAIEAFALFDSSSGPRRAIVHERQDQLEDYSRPRLRVRLDAADDPDGWGEVYVETWRAVPA